MLLNGTLEIYRDVRFFGRYQGGKRTRLARTTHFGSEWTRGRYWPLRVREQPAKGSVVARLVR
jgi:hypothetical protein